MPLLYIAMQDITARVARYLDTPTAVPLATAGTWYKFAIPLSDGNDRLFEEHSTGSYTYVGTKPAYITYIASGGADSNRNCRITGEVRRNNERIDGAVTYFDYDSANEFETLFGFRPFIIQPNDVIDIWFQTDTNSTIINFLSVSLELKGFEGVI